MIIKESFCFDDLMLKPVYSEVVSRSHVSLSVEMPKGFEFAHPLIPANMKDIMSFEMAQYFCQSQALSFLHRFMPLEDQIDIFQKLRQENPAYVNYVGFSVGVKQADREAVASFAKAGAKIVCVDIAHGDSLVCVEMCKWINKNYSDMLLVAGNVATEMGAKHLWDAGADVVKSSVGGGSLCTTRIETGNGVPTLSAIMEIAEMKNYLTRSGLQEYRNRKIAIIADGGLRNSGDAVKSLCFSDMVMIGNLLAGTDEAPGDITVDPVSGAKYKNYAGSSTHKSNHIEGVKAKVKAKGPVVEIVQKLIEGIKSGCAYQGSFNLTELKDGPEFIRISNAGIKESGAHDVIL